MKPLIAQLLSLKISVIVLLGVILTSCEKSQKDLYKEQLIGTWNSTNPSLKSYTFRDNNTFIDTTYYFYPNNPSDYKVLDIITGDYLIKDGQLSFSNVKLTYFDGQESEEIYHYEKIYDSIYNISFNNDILILNQKDIFKSNNETNSGIVGKWSYNKIAALFDSDMENKFSVGIVNGVYDFKSDNNVAWQSEIKYNNINRTSNLSSTYYLYDSLLTINQLGIFDVKISFSTNKMVWLHNDVTFQRK